MKGRFTAANLNYTLAQLGQELPFDNSQKQPTERLLYFGTCRKANSNNSALWKALHKAEGF